MIHSLPFDLRKAINSLLAAKKAWENITPLARNEWICGLLLLRKLRLEKKE